LSEYPITYEYVDGRSIALPWAGQMVPVPPKWVQDRTDVPQRMKLACLSAEIADIYPDAVRPRLVEYVREWPSIRDAGTDLLITGIVPNRRRLWAGAAVMNEITMRYSNWSAVSTAWLAIRGIHWMMDARSKSTEAYQAFRNRVMNAKLLLVEDLFLLGPSSEHRWFLESLYQHRFDNKLSTITTLNTAVEKDWSKVRNLIGPTITEILSTNHEQFHVAFPNVLDADE
jgi:hypothetical protein